MKNYQIGDDPEKNRAVLKQFLRDHAEKFDMGIYYGIDGEDLSEQNRFTASKSPEERLAIFEECGTCCCIVGAMGILTGGDLADRWNHLGTFGLVPAQFDVTSAWPWELSSDYYKARWEEDYLGMVAAAEKAIDHFAKPKE